MCHYILVWYYNCSLKLLPCCSYAAIFNSCREYEQFIRKTWYLENNTDQSRDNFTKESTNKKNGGYKLQNWHPINKRNHVNNLTCWKMKEQFANYICLLPIVLELKIPELIYCWVCIFTTLFMQIWSQSLRNMLIILLRIGRL